jgi:hypothetical protein
MKISNRFDSDEDDYGEFVRKKVTLSDKRKNCLKYFLRDVEFFADEEEPKVQKIGVCREKKSIQGDEK